MDYANINSFTPNFQDILKKLQERELTGQLDAEKQPSAPPVAPPKSDVVYNSPSGAALVRSQAKKNTGSYSAIKSLPGVMETADVNKLGDSGDALRSRLGSILNQNKMLESNNREIDQYFSKMPQKDPMGAVALATDIMLSGDPRYATNFTKMYEQSGLKPMTPDEQFVMKMKAKNESAGQMAKLSTEDIKLLGLLTSKDANKEKLDLLTALQDVFKLVNPQKQGGGPKEQSEDQRYNAWVGKMNSPELKELTTQASAIKSALALIDTKTPVGDVMGQLKVLRAGGDTRISNADKESVRSKLGDLGDRFDQLWSTWFDGGLLDEKNRGDYKRMLKAMSSVVNERYSGIKAERDKLGVGYRIPDSRRKLGLDGAGLGRNALIDFPEEAKPVKDKVMKDGSVWRYKGSGDELKQENYSRIR